jgi:hypothetical protein
MRPPSRDLMSAHLVEISDSNAGERSGGAFCLDFLVHKTTLGSGSIERCAECHHVANAVGVLATTSEGDKDLTVVVGAECFDCRGGEFVDHDNKKAIEC